MLEENKITKDLEKVVGGQITVAREQGEKKREEKKRKEREKNKPRKIRRLG